MYRHILVPLDGSAFAERALPAALAIARDAGARVDLVHVHETLAPSGGAPMYDHRLDDETRASVCRGLDDLVDRLAKKSGLQVRLTCLTGDVKAALDGQIAASGADLIVMSTHASDGLTRALLGSVADHLVRHSSIPVLLVRPGAIGPLTAETPLFDHLLFPLDGSELAAAIIEPALALASPGHTRLTLLRVIVSPMTLSVPATASNAAPFWQGAVEHQTQEATPYLEDVAGRLRARGFTTHVAIRPHEEVAPGILEYTLQREVDLIAMSTHGRGGIGRALLGSVADAVIRDAQVPVLAFRPAALSS